MINRKKGIGLLLFITIGIGLTGCFQTPLEPGIKGGTINLKHWDFETRGTVLLWGNWDFYWNRFLINDNTYTPGEPDGLIHISEGWQKARLTKDISVKNTGGVTYRLKLQMPPEKKRLTIWLPFVYYAHELYLVRPGGKPELLTSGGKIRLNKKGFAPWNGTTIKTFDISGECDLIFQLSSYDNYANPGMREPIMLGREKDVIRAAFLNRQYHYYIQGGLFIIAILMFTLYLLRKDNQAPLWLGLFSLSIAILQMLNNGHLKEMLYPLGSFHLFFKLNFLIVPIAFITYGYYIRVLYKIYFNMWFNTISIAVSILYAIIVIICPTIILSAIFAYYGMIGGLAILWTIVKLTQLVLKKRTIISVLSFCATIILMISAIVEVLILFSLVPGISFFPLGIILLILCHAIIVTFFMEEDRRKAEKLSYELGIKIAKIEHKSELADIITGVLHNVKNLLGSLHVTRERMDTRLNEERGLGGLKRANKLLGEIIENRKEGTDKDPREKELLKYYRALAIKMDEEKKEEKNDLTRIASLLTNIGQLISCQQRYGGRIKLEQVQLTEIIDDALIILANEIRIRQVEIIKSYDLNPRVTNSRILLLHVLINIIKNAFEAMEEKKQGEKKLTFLMDKDEDYIHLRIKDTGCGISKEDMEKMFTYGFTTKKSGSGFGLYSSKLYLEEMGCHITVDSPGARKGTEFSLSIKT